MNPFFLTVLQDTLKAFYVHMYVTLPHPPITSPTPTPTPLSLICSISYGSGFRLTSYSMSIYGFENRKLKPFLKNKFIISNYCKKAVCRNRIQMDLGFFADPDPGFKSPDPDPSIKKLMVLTRFWRSLTKMDRVESAKYEIQFFLL